MNAAVPIPRSRVLTPIELALEIGALEALRHGMHTWSFDPGCAATKSWAKLQAGLMEAGVIGYVARSSHYGSIYYLLYELFPHDPEYFGLCGDGNGDLFAVVREGLVETMLFNPSMS